MLKIIKTDRRTNLSNETLNDLLEIQVEGPPLKDFKADAAIQEWWDDCCTTRRVHQEPRKPYRPRAEASSSTESPPSTSSSVSLSDWDSWMEA